MNRRITVGLMWLCLLFLFPSVAGCAPTDIKWTEEVKLHDGKVIQLKRRTELSATGFPTQKRGHYRYHEFCYMPMGIHWKSKPVYQPETFDIVNGKAYVRVPLPGCTECMLHAFPETNSLYFVWDDAQWKKIDAKEFPAPLRYNLLGMTHADDDGAQDAHGLITLMEKERRDAGIYYQLNATGAKSTSERPRGRDLCARCRRGNIRTDATAEVFLPSGTRNCNW